MSEKAERVVCEYCKEELTNKMEVEYSQWSNDFFCCPDHATAYYFEYMRSVNIDFENTLPEGVEISEDGHLVMVDE